MNDRENFIQALTGISGNLVTPFDELDQFAPGMLRPIIERALRAGVHTLVANGNTSEFYALTSAEAEQMVQAVCEQVDGRAPVVAGVGRSGHEARALARVSRQAGATALMVHQPPDPFVSPRGFFEYVKGIAKAADGLPLVLYLRDESIGLDAIAGLCELQQVVGVKWASPTPLKLAEAKQRCAPEIAWICGLAETWAPPFYAVGARGFTSGLINVWPERSMEIHAHLESGDFEAASAAINDVSAFESLRAQERNGMNVSIVKAALRMLGTSVGPARPPAGWPLTAEQHDQLFRWGTKHQRWGEVKPMQAGVMP
jgi:4-hydroxy-tetrahydrodipicolinate synthase